MGYRITVITLCAMLGAAMGAWLMYAAAERRERIPATVETPAPAADTQTAETVEALQRRLDATEMRVADLEGEIIDLQNKLESARRDAEGDALFLVRGLAIENDLDMPRRR